jgi:hypothetical protein
MVTRQCEVLHELLFEPLHVTHVHVVQAALQACNPMIEGLLDAVLSSYVVMQLL